MKLLILLFLLLFVPTKGWAELQITGNLTQGGLVRGQAAPGSQIFYGERQLKLSGDGKFILGFGRNAGLRHSLTVIAPNGEVTTENLQITPREYQIEKIDGISERLMAPNEEDLLRIRSEAQQVQQARSYDSDLPFFTESFIWPVSGLISGVYGSQRILNGEPRRPHFGVDIAAPKGTPVVAPASGKVRLVHQGMFFSGKTLIIDHGHGLSSSFLHLQKILIKSGQQVSQGDKIATVGATGRVTGPHLDWRINWFDKYLDPVLMVSSPPK
ncbi:M23 family metallopeptidase [Malonomonas rubra]|uniref:M23 family metallopeptidase n=1 Tax=Malonomonas rubra TaxID=57040 RepID=UPI0026EE10C9|nr:M23 family metallopeptidase [Malonomonas rubra]